MRMRLIAQVTRRRENRYRRLDARGLATRRQAGSLPYGSSGRLVVKYRREDHHGERILRSTHQSSCQRIVTATDAYPETLSWLGGVLGHRVRALGVEHFGQSGSISELYGHYGLDVNAILAAAEGMTGRPVRYRWLQK